MVNLTPWIALGALLVGAAIGWVVARRQGRRELETYRLGMEDALKQREGLCWVRTQVPKSD